MQGREDAKMGRGFPFDSSRVGGYGCEYAFASDIGRWIPAFAGMT